MMDDRAKRTWLGRLLLAGLIGVAILGLLDSPDFQSRLIPDFYWSDQVRRASTYLYRREKDVFSSLNGLEAIKAEARAGGPDRAAGSEDDWPARIRLAQGRVFEHLIIFQDAKERLDRLILMQKRESRESGGS